MFRKFLGDAPIFHRSKAVVSKPRQNDVEVLRPSMGFLDTAGISLNLSSLFEWCRPKKHSLNHPLVGGLNPSEKY